MAYNAVVSLNTAEDVSCSEPAVPAFFFLRACSKTSKYRSL
ncbi:hypothetical protein LEP1GSC125_2742 [Leptospira mayottensis 200901122]|uniref:Uncharacterized protein n=1 Tax=Leptospira mayottensis 200901122 TaxID=1193010 RepID=A0AA87MNR3_9LEPT|nr:hypothetical protein LEP1GSC125_2742 [Leptospira mayottensis 200901122]